MTLFDMSFSTLKERYIFPSYSQRNDMIDMVIFGKKDEMESSQTSSNFCAIIEKALKMPSVGPVMVTILSGDEPSDMLMRAPLYKYLFQF